ncbi:MAG: hypothetical protein Q8R86_03580 [Sulfuricurvum sp.]|nr:hypothetical protein [Sulfuricurvum sp.]MDP3464836.1 hypothetical protein [Sulfuricurvum sp.]
MILTLSSIEQTLHIEMSKEQFKHLRDPKITKKEIEAIASDCGVDSTLLTEYTADLKKSAKEMIELDGSCDYSDHL